MNDRREEQTQFWSNAAPQPEPETPRSRARMPWEYPLPHQPLLSMLYPPNMPLPPGSGAGLSAVCHELSSDWSSSRLDGCKRASWRKPRDPRAALAADRATNFGSMAPVCRSGDGGAVGPADPINASAVVPNSVIQCQPVSRRALLAGNGVAVRLELRTAGHGGTAKQFTLGLFQRGSVSARQRYIAGADSACDVAFLLEPAGAQRLGSEQSVAVAQAGCWKRRILSAHRSR